MRKKTNKRLKVNYGWQSVKFKTWRRQREKTDKRAFSGEIFEHF